MTGRSTRTAGAALALALLSGGVPSPARAQDTPTVRVEVDPGPHYVGDPVSIRLVARGFDEEPTPETRVPTPATGRLELAGVSPSVNQSITIINGRMTRTREVSHVFQLRFVAEAPGRVSIGPFRVEQRAAGATAPAVELSVSPVPTTDDLAVRVEVPEGSVFVGERVPVRVEFELAQRLAQNMLSYELRVPLFDHQDRFRFLDDAGDEGSQDVVVQTANGPLEVRARTRDVVRDGETYTVVSFERTAIPLVAGAVDVAPATLSLMEGVRWQRDFFGGRRATRQRRWGASDRPRTLDVLAIPGGEAPPSFAGAIGTGFTFDVAADRSVVQVGDPITLTLTLHGDGVETAGMPPLDAEGLLPPDRFRVQDTQLFGERRGDAKQFVAVVRVLDEGVGEIPALSYSWFDPATQRYDTTQSRPIALSVRSAEVIGAGDVESLAGSEAVGTEDRDAAPAPGDVERARAFALTGADLAIERDPARMLGRRRGFGGAWVVGSLYAFGLCAVPLAVWDRRRRDVDPAVARRRKLVAAEHAKVVAAAKRPPAEAVPAIAASLRRMLAVAPDASSPELDALLGQCDAKSYAPPDVRDAPDPALLERAVALATRIREDAS